MRLLRELAGIGRALRAGLWPPRCAACDVPLVEPPLGDPPPFCEICDVTLVPIGAGRCPRCGQPRPGVGPHEARRPCGACRRRAPGFTRAVAPYEFGGALAEAVRRFKYAPAPDLGSALGRLLATSLPPPELDVLLPVPLHVKRLRSRGFNQALLLARTAAARWDVPVDWRTLIRQRATAPQVRQPTVAARARNVAGAFAVREPSRVAGRHVALVDDVLTTGATAGACARALRAAGASEVTVITLGRG